MTDPTQVSRVGPIFLDRMQNSIMAMRPATSIRLPGGDPIWEGRAVLRVDLNERERFQWTLAEAILHEPVTEARADSASVAILLMPYLPEVHDDVWNASFGQWRDDDRHAGGRRLRADTNQGQRMADRPRLNAGGP